MWLLDVNMPMKVAGVLRAFGITSQTAEDRGWGGLTNGALVEAAVNAGFRCVLTRDRLFGESAARALKRFPEFCVVLVEIPQLRGREFIDQFQAAWGRAPIEVAAGLLVHWPSA